MPDISKVRLDDTVYEIKDKVARSNLGNLADLATQNKGSIVDAVNELASSESDTSVRYTEQTLTDDEKKQARDNIGVGATIADTLIDLNLVAPVSEDDGDVLSTADGTILVLGGAEPPFIKTINGEKPDVDGNVNVVIPETVASWNDLTDKPFDERIDTYSLTWDCNPDDVESASPSDSVTMYKISDEIVSNGDYDNCIISTVESDGTVIGTDTIPSDEFEYLSELDLLGMISALGIVLYCVPASGAPLTDTITVSGGVWVTVMSGIDTLAGATMNITFSKTTLRQIEEKYIPDTIARSEDVAQSDMAQTDDTAPDYVKNKTHWSESGTITILKEVTVAFGPYDGTAATLINRRVILDAEKLNALVDNDDITSAYCNVKWNDTGYYSVHINSYNETDEQISWNVGNYNLASNPTYESGSYPFYIQRLKNNQTGEDSFTIWAQGSEAATVTLSITGYGIAYTQLNDRFISDNIARKHDIITDWNELTNTPFNKNTTRTTLTYDGVTDGRDYASVNVASYAYGPKFYKVSDGHLPDNLVVKCITRTSSSGYNSILDFPPVYGDGVVSYTVVLDVRSATFTLDGNTYTAPSEGVYFWGVAGTGNGYCSSFTYEVKEETLKPDCLPKASAVADAAGEAPTAAEFNALLAALREAGYLAV